MFFFDFPEESQKGIIFLLKNHGKANRHPRESGDPFYSFSSYALTPNALRLKHRKITDCIPQFLPGTDTHKNITCKPVIFSELDLKYGIGPQVVFIR